MIPFSLTLKTAVLLFMEVLLLLLKKEHYAATQLFAMSDGSMVIIPAQL